MLGEREARMALAGLESLGAIGFAKALAEFGPVDLWDGFVGQAETTTWGRKAAALDLDGLRRATDACGARFLIPGDAEWPVGLSDLDRVQVAQQGGQPVGLWAIGEQLNQLDTAVAVVGARAASGYGEQVALTLAADLAAAGHVVVSGMAFGIDGAAHRGALGVGGRSVAVVACGVDEPYPSAHRQLAAALAETGSIVSELPPGLRPTRYAFLARNRIIAALSSAVVVVEAALRSGAKNTASWASALGRPLFAVPGPVTSSLSATPHRLIRDGEAILCAGAADVESVLAPLGSLPEAESRGEQRPVDRLSPGLFEMREAVLPGEEVVFSQLCARTGQPVLEALANAAELVELGWLEELADGRFRLPRRPAG